MTDTLAPVQARIVHSDCLTALRAMNDNSVDSIVTDPPYGLAELPADKVIAALTQWLSGNREFVPDGRGFMSHDWDSFVPPPAVWDECLRVLKPGGHLLAFAGSRTVDLMGMSIRIAGFELRDSINWAYGTGFPHGIDLSKAVDARLGAEREVVGYDPTRARPNRMYEAGAIGNIGATGDRKISDRTDNGATITAPATEESARWAGWNTTLKPSQEPIIVARKPFAGTVADNLLQHGVGGINIDGCRTVVHGEREGRVAGVRPEVTGNVYRGRRRGSEAVEPTTLGRYPANTILTHHPACVSLGFKNVKGDGHHPASRGAGGIGQDGHRGQEGLEERTAATETVAAFDCVPGCPISLMDDQSGEAGQAGDVAPGIPRTSQHIYGQMGATVERIKRGDSGGASRFFDCSTWTTDDLDAAFLYAAKAPQIERPVGADGTRHVSVKPLAVMRWLTRLVTPEGGIVLDPFTGSGTTIEAALIEGFQPIGVERHQPYLQLIDLRLARWQRAQERWIDPDHPRYLEEPASEPAPPAIDGQLGMFD